METTEMIAASGFCIQHKIEQSFLISLHESGLISVVKTGDDIFVPVNQLPDLEKMVRLYYEMDINIEGIETITYLLQRMNEMQQHIAALHSRLGIYETSQENAAG